MRIDSRVAVSGKMLSCRDHAVILQAMNERDTHSRCELRIFAVRARVDDRIVGIVVDIQNGSVRDVNSKCASFDRRETTFLVSECGITRCSDRHLRREEAGTAEVDRVGNEIPAACAEAGTGFQVGPEQERNLAHRLERVELRRNFCRRAHRYREPADLFLLNVLRQPPPLRRVAGYVIAEHARPDYLRRFLPQRHRGHHGISPARGCHGGAPSATGTTAQSRTARRERDER